MNYDKNVAFLGFLMLAAPDLPELSFLDLGLKSLETSGFKNKLRIFNLES